MPSTIKNLENIFDKVVLDHAIVEFSEPIENYASLIASVNLTTEDEKITMVGKFVPPSPAIYKLSNIELGFRKEIVFYKNIVPVLEEFGAKEDCSWTNLFPRFYGGRLNLDNNDLLELDSNGVILLEDLRLTKYKILDRIEGFELDTARAVLKNLARFHAVPLGFKLKNQQLFQDQIKNLLPKFEFHGNAEKIEVIAKNCLTHLKKVSSSNLLYERIAKVIVTQPNSQLRERFSTITHNDLWTNNIVLKYEHGKPVDVKFLDFQSYDYGSPAKDVLFFLFTSVKDRVLEDNCDCLIEEYYAELMSILQKLNCNTNDFSFKDFKEEIDFEAKNSQLCAIIFALSAIFYPKNKKIEIDLLDLDYIDSISKNVSSEMLQKLKFLVEEADRRNWI